MVSYQINVYGRVQGVGFRWFTQQAAERHHISGWVRNKTDGSVEMAIQGEPAAIDRFLAIIAAGPGAYRHVTQLVKTPIAPFEGKNFTIR